MGCCGQQRAALVNANAAESREGATAISDGIGPYVPLEFTRRTNIIVRGPVTGRGYRFQEGAHVQSVDPRDAAALITTGYFRRA
jgi:hypothetical protein